MRFGGGRDRYSQACAKMWSQLNWRASYSRRRDFGGRGPGKATTVRLTPR